MSPRVRAFLVDDEALALGHLAELLEQTGRVEIVGRATRAAEALTSPAARAADVLFVDIQMPGMSGLELVERLPAGPAVVFTTGYERYAVQAFEVSAVDYLMKPIRRERLERALDRVEARRAEPGGAGQWALERLAGYLRGDARGYLDRVPVPGRAHTGLLEVAAITHFVAEGRGAWAVGPGGEKTLLALALSDLEDRLEPGKFIRVHRATLVHLAWVDTVHAWPGGRLQLELKDGARTRIEVARQRVEAVRQRLGLG